MTQLFTEDEVRKVIAEAVSPLLARVAQLEAEVARLKKNSGNSSKPPSSDIVKPPKPEASKHKGKRSIGGQPGHARHERKPFGPDKVDRIVECELTDEEAHGLQPLQRWRIVQQVELVERPFLVTEYRVRQYLDQRTGQIITTALPQDVAGTGLVGPRLSAAIAFQKAVCHMSYTTIHNFWLDLRGCTSVVGNWRKLSRRFHTQSSDRTKNCVMLWPANRVWESTSRDTRMQVGVTGLGAFALRNLRSFTSIPREAARFCRRCWARRLAA